MLSTGGLFSNLNIPTSRKEIYAAATFYTRLNRGTRTDVVTIFDRDNLAPIGEVIIPAKRGTGMPNLALSALTDDDRFMLVYNMTPAQSISVVNVVDRSFVGEIPIPGCALVYATGDRQFANVCGDGRLLTVNLDDDGNEAGKQRSEPFFDPRTDPVTEKAVRAGDVGYFVSFNGIVHPVDVSGAEPQFPEAWSLFNDEDRAESWRIGGAQHLAAHQERGLLFSLVHQGGVDTHKDPGTQVWVYDLGSKKLVQRIQLQGIATAIQVTQDDEPVLLTSFIGEPALQVYDAETGQHLRAIDQLGNTPTLIQYN